MKRLSERLAAKPRHFQRHYLQRPDHLIRSEQFKKYGECLSDYEFVEAKVQHPEFGVQALIEDYDWLNDAEVTATLDPETVQALALIQGALRLSAHVLERDVTQLAGQLWGRLPLHEYPEVCGLLTKAQQSPITPRLRPLTASLIPAGGRLVQKLSGHSHFVNTLVAKENSCVISSSHDGTVKVWNSKRTGNFQRFSFDEKKGSKVESLSTSRDGQILIYGYRDGTITARYIETGGSLFSYNAGYIPTALEITDNGSIIFSGSDSGLIRVKHTHDSEHRLCIEAHKGGILNLKLIEKNSKLVSIAYDNKIKVWEIKKQKQNLFLTEKLCLCLDNIDGLVMSADVAEDGSQIIVGTDSGIVKCWDLKTKKLYKAPNKTNFIVVDIVITSDVSKAVFALDNGELKIWDLLTKKLHTFQKAVADFATAMAISKNQSKLFTGSSTGAIKVWDLESEKLGFGQNNHDKKNTGESSIIHTSISKDPHQAVFVSSDGIFGIRELKTGNIIYSKKLLRNDTQKIRAASVTRDTSYVVFGYENGVIQMLDVKTGHVERSIKAHDSWINDLAIIDNKFTNSFIAVSGSVDGTIKLFDLETGKSNLNLKGHFSWTSAVDISKNESKMVSGSQDRTIKIWDIKTGNLCASFKNESCINAISFAKSNSIVVFGSKDGQIKFWNVRAGNLLFSLQGQGGEISSVDVARNHSIVVSGYFDGTVEYWDLKKLQRVTFTADHSILNCAVSTDGQTIVAGDSGGQVHLLRLELPEEA